MGGFTGGPSGTARMRPPTQDSVSWPHGELHRRHQWQSSHASPTQYSVSWPHSEANPIPETA
eukprot:7420394-Pyramimonas_sp.AAC.1